MKNKKVVISIAIIAVVLLGGLGYWYTQIKVPYDNSVKAFELVKKSVLDNNNELEKNIENSELVIKSDKKALNEDLITELESEISVAKDSIVIVPELPKKKIDIDNATKQLSPIKDYTSIINNLNAKTEDVLLSISQLEQLTNPSEEFVISRLEPIEDIIEIKSVTEDNDPNGQLNKAGGYTSAIFFASDKIDQREVSGRDVIDKGTVAGGSIEVYPTVDEAERRNMYLSAFDVGMLSPGSHSTIGTLVIRTSYNLTATQQKELEEKIINELIRLK